MATKYKFDIIDLKLCLFQIPNKIKFNTHDEAVKSFGKLLVPIGTLSLKDAVFFALSLSTIPVKQEGTDM